MLGGTACLWSEYIDASSLVPLAFPRASAVAERLWSPSIHAGQDNVYRRMDDWRCSMVHRGIAAQPASWYFFYVNPCINEYEPVYIPPWENKETIIVTEYILSDECQATTATTNMMPLLSLFLFVTVAFGYIRIRKRYI